MNARATHDCGGAREQGISDCLAGASMGWFSEQSVAVEKEPVRVSLPHAREPNARVPLRVLKTEGG